MEITGIDPSLYGGLRDESQRTAFLRDVQIKFDTLVNGQDPSVSGLQDGSLMSIQALKLIQAMREGFAKKAYIDSLGKKYGQSCRKMAISMPHC